MHSIEINNWQRARNGATHMSYPRREYVNAVCASQRKERTVSAVIVVSLIGPNGGTAATGSLTLDSAQALRDQLTEALSKFE